MKPKISAIIITKNEETKLRDCLNSLSFVDEIIVVDSGSTDGTLETAKQYGAKIFINFFEGYGKQKNFALSKATHDWVLSIDADERVTEKLEKEIADLDFEKIDGYEIPRLTYFLGKPIKHGGPWWYPGYTLRFFNKRQGKFRNIKVHETVEIKGKVKKLNSPLDHYSYDSLSDYFRKFNTMTDLQASLSITPWRTRNYILIVLKPIYRFLQMYIWYLGVLEGFRGFMLALFSSWYVAVVYFKSWERSNKMVKQ